MIRSLALLVIGLFSAAGCSFSPETLAPCNPIAEGEGAICGLMNPEDLASLPELAWVIVSQMTHAGDSAGEGGQPARPGNLLALDPDSDERHVLFPLPPVGGADGTPEAVSAWGEDGCPGPPDPKRFAPHGIDLRRNSEGAAVLAVVNHGGREAVELFELLTDRDAPEAEWRGCVLMPAGMMMNDVALVPSGGFVVTHMLPEIRGFGALWTLLELLMGSNTGAILRWQPGQGIETLPDSEGCAPNGVAVAPDESAVFVAEWGAQAVYRVPLSDESLGAFGRAQVALEHSPDNLTWADDDTLLVAGQAGGPLKALPCGAIEEGSCALDYGVYRIDARTLTAELVTEGKGAASVALARGEEILVGSFAGDRIDRVVLDASR